MENENVRDSIVEKLRLIDKAVREEDESVAVIYMPKVLRRVKNEPAK